MEKSRGLRNNNPGNLILTNIAWQGKIPNKQNTDGKFEQFTSIEYGIRAMYKDLVNDINKGKNTVTKLISEYAPPSENNTKQYINDVCATLGVKANDVLKTINSDFLLKLGRSIVTKENGNDGKLVTDAQLMKGMQLMGDVSTDKLKFVFKNSTKYILPLALLFYSVFTFTL